MPDQNFQVPEISMLRFSAITATSGAVPEVRSRIDFAPATNVLRSVQKALRGFISQTSVSEVGGTWVAPVIAGLGFQAWLGFDKRGALVISLDITSESAAVKHKARVNARTWADMFFSKLPEFANRVQKKRTQASDGAVLIPLEPDGFASQPEEELRSKVQKYADELYIPFVKFLIERQTESRA